MLGFSQGAIVASLISAMKNNNHATENAFESLKFSIMISGFPSRAPVHKELYETPIDVPSMHVWGQLDTLVPNIGSKMLLEKFQLDNRQHFIHHKGHLVPSDSASRKAISAFLLKISDEINARDEETLRAAL